MNDSELPFSCNRDTPPGNPFRDPELEALRKLPRGRIGRDGKIYPANKPKRASQLSKNVNSATSQGIIRRTDEPGEDDWRP